MKLRTHAMHLVDLMTEQKRFDLFHKVSQSTFSVINTFVIQDRGALAGLALEGEDFEVHRAKFKDIMMTFGKLSDSILDVYMHQAFVALTKALLEWEVNNNVEKGFPKMTWACVEECPSGEDIRMIEEHLQQATFYLHACETAGATWINPQQPAYMKIGGYCNLRLYPELLAYGRLRLQDCKEDFSDVADAPTEHLLKLLEAARRAAPVEGEQSNLIGQLMREELRLLASTCEMTYLKLEVLAAETVNAQKDAIEVVEGRLDKILEGDETDSRGLLQNSNSEHAKSIGESWITWQKIIAASEAFMGKVLAMLEENLCQKLEPKA